MNLHAALTLLACLGHLAFAILAWLRRAQSRLALLVAALFLDAFTWNFAEFAQQLFGRGEWWRVDRAFASLMPALCLHVVLMFVGKARTWRALLTTSYAGFCLIGLGSWDYAVWWRLLLGASVLVMSFAGYCLLAHLKRTRDALERARTWLLLWAIVVGTSVGSTDIWFDKINLPVPPVSNVGTLVAMGLFAAAALRLDLLGGGAIPRTLLVYALGFAAFSLLGYLSAMRWLDRGLAFWLFGTMTITMLVFAGWRELGRASALAQERTQRLTALGRCSEQLAHDLRNPLAALKGALQFLSIEREQGRSLDQHAQFLELLVEQTARIERTLLAYQRLARVEPETSLVSLNHMVSEVVGAQRFAVHPDVRVELELGETVPDCLLDRDLVATALENLLRNACEAMPQGGKIWVHTELAANSAETRLIRLSIRDDGPGMDARQLERVGEEAFTTKAGGSGLGLNFATRVAKAHGGSFEIESNLGAGTTVRLTFPERAAERKSA
jgi:two-component system, NtrC family, sensor histidine kinase HydH